MEQQHMIILGVSITILLTAFLLWGPNNKRKSKGKVVGLVNLGATCFMNTLLQALASCALFVEWLDVQNADDKPLTAALQHILWVLNGQSEDEAYSPNAIFAVLKRHGWVLPSGEQDAHELFHCMVSTLQEENKKQRQPGSLSDALPASDTLSQASDILDDPFEPVEIANSSPPGGGDLGSEISAKTVYLSANASCKSSNASVKTDSDSPSAGTDFYSIDSEKTSSIDGSDETLKVLSPHKSSMARGHLDKLRSSPESIQRGVFDRTGSSTPPFQVSESPPFQGLLASSLQCHSCGNSSSVRADTFDSLSLPLGESPIPARHSLPDLLRQFVRTEIIPDVDCEKCGKKTNALKTFNFGKLPPCLCFHISRTAWLSSARTPSKRDDHVEFREYLVMDPFTWKPGACLVEAPPPATAKHLYRLKSVVVHVGNASSGHFLTYRRGPLTSDIRHGKKKSASFTDSSRWFMTSDETVQLSSMAKAMDSLAYMLFYEKCRPTKLVTDN